MGSFAALSHKRVFLPVYFFYISVPSADLEDISTYSWCRGHNGEKTLSASCQDAKHMYCVGDNKVASITVPTPACCCSRARPDPGAQSVARGGCRGVDSPCVAEGNPHVKGDRKVLRVLCKEELGVSETTKVFHFPQRWKPEVVTGDYLFYRCDCTWHCTLFER